MYLFGIHAIYFWVIVLVATIALEGFTLNLTAIWFAIGALFALIAASLGIQLLSQLVLFVIVSAILLILVRPFTQKFLQIKGERTNADRILGQTAVVVETIQNQQAKGQIQLLGQIWTARSADGSILPEGTEVTVLSISGVKAIVEKKV